MCKRWIVWLRAAEGQPYEQVGSAATEAEAERQLTAFPPGASVLVLAAGINPNSQKRAAAGKGGQGSHPWRSHKGHQ